MNLYLQQRGNAKFRKVEDMFATKTFSGDLPVLQNAFGAKANECGSKPELKLEPAAHELFTLRVNPHQTLAQSIFYTGAQFIEEREGKPRAPLDTTSIVSYRRDEKTAETV